MSKKRAKSICQVFTRVSEQKIKQTKKVGGGSGSKASHSISGTLLCINQLPWDVAGGKNNSIFVQSRIERLENSNLSKQGTIYV